MAAEIPTTELQEIIAGTTAKWTRSLGDFPASDGWTLSYAFLRDPDGVLITFSSTASGSDHLVNVDAGTTAGWGAGDYNGQAFVSKAGEKYRVWQGTLTVLPNFASNENLDTRSKAKRILDFIDASFEKLVKKQPVSATIEGVQFHFRSLDELIRARNYWAGTVSQEEQAQTTGGVQGVILARFTRPT